MKPLTEWNDCRAHFISRTVPGKPAAKLCVASEHWEGQGWQQMQKENWHHMKVKDLEVPNAEGSWVKQVSAELCGLSHAVDTAGIL